MAHFPGTPGFTGFNTPTRIEAERAAGRALFGADRNPLTDDESVKGRIRGTASGSISRRRAARAIACSVAG
jgi:hypothetical protein